MRLLLIFLTVSSTAWYGFSEKRQIKVARLEGFCRGQQVPITLKITSFHTQDSFLFVNQTTTVTEDLNNLINMSITIERCKQKDNPDTCEMFHKFQSSKYCQIIEQEMWGAYFFAIQPKWKCPIKKGTYVGTNGKFDVSAFVLFPIENWYWRVSTYLYDMVTNRLLMCNKAEAFISFQSK